MQNLEEKKVSQVVVFVPFNELKDDLAQIVRDEMSKQSPVEKVESKKPSVRFYTPTQVREMFHISRTTLHNWNKSQYLVPRKIGGKVLYEKSVVDAFLSSKFNK